ncbi:MAG: glycine zipper 2TM domain-containing protein [Betaproteobacteria bacterium]|nr:glycine zipper 2TM domain-containing protein [Betaproteobacteria bacterium]
MKRLFLLCLFSMSSAALAATMTNDDVVKMVKGGVGDSLILQQIDRSEPAFDTSVDGVIRLKKSGVSDTVIDRMMNRRAAPAPAAAPAAALAPPVGGGAPPALSVTCRECGVIEFVREVEKAGQAGGTGAVAGGVAGAVVGRGISNDRNRTFGTIAGGVAGAVAGHQIEKAVKTSKYWETVVRFEDGTARSYQQEQQPLWRQGDRVRVVNGVVGLQ